MGEQLTLGDLRRLDLPDDTPIILNDNSGLLEPFYSARIAWRWRCVPVDTTFPGSWRSGHMQPRATPVLIIE